MGKWLNFLRMLHKTDVDYSLCGWECAQGEKQLGSSSSMEEEEEEEEEVYGFMVSRDQSQRVRERTHYVVQQVKWPWRDLSLECGLDAYVAWWWASQLGRDLWSILRTRSKLCTEKFWIKQPFVQKIRLWWSVLRCWFYCPASCRTHAHCELWLQKNKARSFLLFFSPVFFTPRNLKVADSEIGANERGAKKERTSFYFLCLIKWPEVIW